LTRGQYESAHPTNVLQNPLRVLDLASIVVEGVGSEFTWAFTVIALVPFFFLLRMQKRERAWLIGLLAVYFFMAFLLSLMLNPTRERQSLELNRVFFTASHAIVAMFVGYGVTLIVSSLLMWRDAALKWLPVATLLLSVAALDIICTVPFEMYGDNLRADGIEQLVWGITLLATAVLLWFNLQPEKIAIPIISSLVALGGLYLVGFGIRNMWVAKVHPFRCAGVVMHGLWEKLRYNDPTLKIYGAVIVAGIVLAALVIVWTQRQNIRLSWLLALAACMPLYSILSNWADNEQRGHWFGYWFGHDMFTPPFADSNNKFGAYDAKEREQALKGPKAKLVYPEMTRDAILFGGTDPGRFAPTYMIFCDSFIPHKDLPVFDQNFDRRDVYIITQNALADGTYLEYIRSHYFRSDQYQYDTPFFLEALRPKREIGGLSTNFVAALAYECLDKPLTKLGAKIEKNRRARGVYPPKEIYEPTPDDSRDCFTRYTEDAQRRMQHDMQFPNEPRQIRPGENVTPVNEGGYYRIQVSGQVAVMAINALLTKVIFDHNPTNEFFVEESFPLDWMYPHLTPFGIIMKINREPLPELTDEICQRDHEFWARYSERFIGNWITYETPVKDIADFAERVYLRHDFSGFKGDRAFVRDDQAQKAFSKLRSSIAGVYAWRLGMSGSPTEPQYLAKPGPERDRMLREADFAFKQAFAYCPYSPEAVYRYINLLANPNVGRLDDALIVAETCLKFDPYNGSIISLVEQLRGMKSGPNAKAQVESEIAKLETELKANPNDFQKAFDLAARYMQLQQTDRVMGILDSVVKNPQAPANAIFGAAQAYAQLNNLEKLEGALQRLVVLAPTEAEAWYNLAATKATRGKSNEALQDLRRALELSDLRRAANTNAHNLRDEVERDNHFTTMRGTPEFQALLKH
jgi:tetratricopeptide (TPR) repeat protein